MTDRVLTNAQMREADNYTINDLGVSSEELMNRAGLAIAEEVLKSADRLNVDDILVVCGTGNNSGDGYVCAQRLYKKGLNVKVYALTGNLSIDCKREKDRYKGEYSSHICGAIIVDCIFGTGLTREVSGEYAEIINEINRSGSYVISADIPSGLNGDNGLILGCAVKADLTVAIAEYKAGAFLNEGLDFCGELVKKDIGIVCPESDYIKLNCPRNMQGLFAHRKRNSNKGTYGSANLIVGSEKYAGAAVLALNGAVRSGCGYVKLTSCEKLKYALLTAFPQVIYQEDADLFSDSIAVGCGLGVSEELYREIKFILQSYTRKLVLDADALNAIAKYGTDVLKNKKCGVVITPHVKEFSRLTGTPVEEIISNPIEAAKSFAAEYGVTVLLKSASSVITDGEKVLISARGTSSLAKGGSGDILAGFLCGTLARGLDLFEASVCAAGALGEAAEIASEEKTDYCATAEDIIKNLHFSIMRLTE